MNFRTLRPTGSLILGVCISMACGPGGGVRTPGPPNADQRGDAEIVGYLLNEPDLLRLGDSIRVICVGIGEGGTGVPSFDFFEAFAGREPFVRAAPACNRSTDPAGLYPIIKSSGGEPAILLSIGDWEGPNWAADVKIESSGTEPQLLRCELDLVFGVAEKVVLRDPPVRSMSAEPAVFPINVKGCEVRS